MIRSVLIYVVIQILTFVLAFFVFGITLAGGHKLLFFAGAWQVAIIITVLTSIPLIYLFGQRKKLKKKETLITFLFALFIFLSANTILYIGVPNLIKQFTIENKWINKASILKDNSLNIDLKLAPEMFKRVSIEMRVNKSNDIELKDIKLTVFNETGEIISPVFQPLSWDSIHSETIQMNSYFEDNRYTRLNEFSLSAQYSIEHSDILKLQIDYTFTKNGQIISNHQKLGVGIANHLILEKTMEY